MSRHSPNSLEEYAKSIHHGSTKRWDSTLQTQYKKSKMNEQLKTGCKRRLKVRLGGVPMIINIIEARDG